MQETLLDSRRMMLLLGAGGLLLTAWVASGIAFLPVFVAAAAMALATIPSLVWRWPAILAISQMIAAAFRLPEILPVLLPLHLQLGLNLLVAISLAVLLATRETIKLQREIVMMLAFTALVVLSIFYALSPGATVARLGDFLKVVFVSVAISLLIKTRAQRQGCLAALILVGAIMAGRAVFNKIMGIGLVEGTRVTVGGDVSSVLGDPNELSLFLLLPLSCCAAFVMDTKRYAWRLFAFACLMLMITAIAFAQSRGAFLSIVVVIFLHLRRMSGSVLAVLLLAAVSAALYSMSGLEHRVVVDHEIGLDESAEIRLQLWTIGLESLLRNPLLGVGADNFPILSLHVVGRDWVPHNTWVQVSSETGLIGFSIFLGMIGTAIQSARHALRNAVPGEPPTVEQTLARGAMISLVGACVASTFLSEAYAWPIYTNVAVIAAATNGFARVARRSPLLSLDHGWVER